MSFKKNDPKIIKGWVFYDWANSVYSLVITSTIFPIFYSSLTTDTYKKIYNSYQDVWFDEPIQSKIEILGHFFAPDALFSYSLTISFILVVLSTPVLSSIADVTGTKKKFLKFFCYLGSFSCMALFFFTDKSRIIYGLFLNVTASIGFWGSLVFYNSYLPDIATEDEQDRVSAKGYIMGYAGAMILLILCLVLIEKVANVENKEFYTRLSFILTGIWWLGFGQYTFSVLPDNPKQSGVRKRSLILSSFSNLKKIQTELFEIRNLKYFLFSFFFYSIGIQTIFLMAALFGANEINLNSFKLIISILLTQLIAIIGAYLCSALSKKVGNKMVLIICICIWIGICIAGFLLDKTNPNIEYYFYVVAGMVGLVMGGIQSISRSTYSKMLPEKDQHITTTYFSFYDVIEKFAIIVGSFIYGLLIDLTGNMRYSILAMSVTFIIGLFFMFFVRFKNTNTIN
ncbi:MFS transporter [Apibacter sp. HY039]|uniref:MFS transporter n=1 Tax=Apibacter sp. HY039 TaxID=2501476 RepID=UPI002104BD52|nr:MFS transporter [Apibacter sp. HY039]